MGFTDPTSDQTIALCVEKGWEVVLGCRTCGRQVGFAGDALAERFPAHVTLGAIRERAKCQCGSDDVIVYYRQSRATRARIRDLGPPKS